MVAAGAAVACAGAAVGEITEFGGATPALLAGIDPWELTEWMWSGLVDGAEWVMLPNVIGMALHADGGRMATKPYAAGGAYIDKMSDYCGPCAYDRRKRVGPAACPFTPHQRVPLIMGSVRGVRDVAAIHEGIEPMFDNSDAPLFARRGANVILVGTDEGVKSITPR